MKGVVVYDTSYGNTEMIARTIAETLSESGVEADLFHVKAVKRLNTDNYNFIVIGSPTRMGTMSLTVRRFLGKLKREEWVNKPFVAFDTELPDNLEHKEWSAAEKIADKLVEKKMNQLMPTLKTAVMGSKGPLKEGEIDRTRKYAEQLASKLKVEKV
jgi:menaquinone-dependent protoporphyrinogen IX oxidase